MTKPQQPELAKDRLGDQDRDGKDLRAGGAEKVQEPRGGIAPVPEDNKPGRRPEHEQDKPDGPPG
jgi:hypothetical protein